ncbi:hypothetical protein P692DRAFT_20746742 [Suillus brevipes Sb2]|nr:hypothetical protein P692DRAFT_20746742 [Suillus brevipes Sb2]
MVTQRNVLHGDLSPNNFIIHDGKGYFIDFNHPNSSRTMQQSIRVVCKLFNTFFVYSTYLILVNLERNCTLHILPSFQAHGRRSASIHDRPQSL